MDKTCRKALILGRHPIAKYLLAKYTERGWEAVQMEAMDLACPDADEVVVLSSPEGDKYDSDNQAISMLGEFAALQAKPQKTVAHLLLQSETVLALVQANGLAKNITDRLDVYPTTLASEWAKTILPDHKPITQASNRHAHIVIFGNGDEAITTAIAMARIAHFPTYIKDHSCRTRITMVCDDAQSLAATMRQRYASLFDNCFSRIVDCSDAENAVKSTFAPANHGKREDFVDIEWEFAKGNVNTPLLRHKISRWSSDPSQVMTIVMAYPNASEANLNAALILPGETAMNDVPVYVWLSGRELLDGVDIAQSHKNIRPIGMLNCGYDTSLPFVEVGKTVNHIYSAFYADNDKNLNSGNIRDVVFVIDIDEEKRQKEWETLPAAKRQASIANGLSLRQKLHAVGIAERDYEKFYELSSRQIDVLSEVEHNRWTVETLLLGFRPCTEQEEEEIAANPQLKNQYKQKKVHYDLRPYADLRSDETGKNVIIYDVALTAALPLIAKRHAALFNSEKDE